MNNDLQELFKYLLSAILFIGLGYYLKIAKNKEPYGYKNLWKILIALGIIGFIISLVKYLI